MNDVLGSVWQQPALGQPEHRQSSARIEQNIHSPGTEDNASSGQSPGSDLRPMSNPIVSHREESSVIVPPYVDDPFNNFLLSETLNFSQDVPFVPGDFDEDVNFNLSNIDFDTFESAYEYLDSGTPEQQLLRTHHGEQSGVLKEALKRHVAFKRSPWLFVPTSNDYALQDHEDLALNEDSIPVTLTPSSHAPSESEISSFRIASKNRDRLLSILFAIPRQDPDNVPTLPSVSFLNNIIQIFFAQETFRTDSLIHSGTLDPDKAIPQLLLAIISFGSTYVSIPAVWKMGMALQEIVRFTVAELVRTQT